MIIQENQLRPPSPKEMAERRVPLERIRLDWPGTCYTGEECCPSGRGRADTYHALEFTTLELIEFHKDWQIPYEALVDGDGYDGEKALDWTHIVKCEGCGQWYDTNEAHETTDTSLHGYIMRARAAAIEAAKKRDKGRLLADEKALLDGICR